MKDVQDLPIVFDLKFEAQAVAHGLHFPTSMVFLDTDDILVTEKDTGIVKRVLNGTVLDEPILDVNVANQFERGMLGMAITTHRSTDEMVFGNNSIKHAFLYFTESSNGDGSDARNGNEPLGNRLYRYDFVDGKLRNPKLLLDLPATPNRHNGGGLVTDRNNNIFLSIGDINHNTTTQNFENGLPPDGTSVIHKIAENGQPGNGTIGSEEPLITYYAYGIRNNFGLDIDPVTGNLWATEDGYNNIDELNLVKPGFNSGWKDIQGFKSVKETDPELKRRERENAGSLVDFEGRGEYADPKFVWNHSVTPTAVKFFHSDKFGREYENDLFVGDFNNGNIYHFDLNRERDGLSLPLQLKDRMSNGFSELKQVLFGLRFGGETNLYIKEHNSFGGITDIEVGPDGYLYVLTFRENNGTIYRIVPATS